MKIKTDAKNITPVPSGEFPTAAARPKNSRLDTERLQKAFALYLPPWEQGVYRAVQEIIACK